MCNPVLDSTESNLLERYIRKGYEVEITKNKMGFRCGYVKVDPDHPYHGVDGSDMDLYVHGGITFSDYDKLCDKEGRDNGYWIGFDCAHYLDRPDPELMSPPNDLVSKFWDEMGGEIRDQEYVKNQCNRLVDQLIEIKVKY